MWLFQVLLEKQKLDFYYAFLSLLFMRSFWKKQTKQKIFYFFPQSSILIKYIVKYFELISAFLNTGIDLAFQWPVAARLCGSYTDILFQKY